MSFSQALEILKEGKTVTREGWNGPGQWIMVQRPDAHSKMTEPYIYIKNTSNKLVPWLASQGDLMAEDWIEVHIQSDPQESLPIG